MLTGQLYSLSCGLNIMTSAEEIQMMRGLIKITQMTKITKLSKTQTL